MDVEFLTWLLSLFLTLYSFKLSLKLYLDFDSNSNYEAFFSRYF